MNIEDKTNNMLVFIIEKLESDLRNLQTKEQALVKTADTCVEGLNNTNFFTGLISENTADDCKLLYHTNIMECILGALEYAGCVKGIDEILKEYATCIKKLRANKELQNEIDRQIKSTEIVLIESVGPKVARRISLISQAGGMNE